MALALALALALVPSVFADDCCLRPWNDYCPGAGGTCTTFAPPPPAPTDWKALRGALRNEVFGRSDGLLPSAGVDAVELVGGNSGRGCWCSTLGRCDASSCTWPANLTRLTFTVSASFPNGSLALALNSTVYYTLNTSGVAPINYPAGGPPEFPPIAMGPKRGGTLVLFHNGHNQPCSDNVTTDDDSTVDWLNQLGYDVMVGASAACACKWVRRAHAKCERPRMPIRTCAFACMRADRPPCRRASTCRCMQRTSTQRPTATTTSSRPLRLRACQP